MRKGVIKIKQSNEIKVYDWQIETLARLLLPEILKFYENEDNVQEFKKWEAEQNAKKTRRTP